VQSAVRNGHDLRTIQLQNGTSIRLLTYALPGGDENPAFLQLGRPLNDQERTLNQLVVVMASLGGAMLILLGLGSWWIAGRSISPAEAAWHKQQAFIANAGHELRAPLTLIRANTEVALRRTSKDDPRRTTLEDTLEETEHMGSLVSDLLMLSRLDTGALKLDLQAIAVPQLLEDLSRQVKALADEQNVMVSASAAEGEAIADRTRLRQVLLILFDNALGYTDSGGKITFSSEVQGDRVRIAVEDTGIGIRPEDLAHVFERFYQVERDGRSGSGLGLSIAKSLVEAMHGKLDLTSSVDEGTTVTLTIPAAR
jgi:signal transduction histidine kinase